MRFVERSPELYLQADGSIALAGAWDMGNQALTNVNIDSGAIADVVTHSQWDAAYSHISSNGSAHSYIDQSVVVAGTPQFANLGIGVAASAFPLDIVGAGPDSLCQFRLGSNVTDNTTKYSAFCARHYANAEENIIFLGGAMTAAANGAAWGGGHPSFNTVTGHGFHAAANNTTLTGTKIFEIDTTGVQINEHLPLKFKGLYISAQIDMTAGGNLEFQSSGGILKFLDELEMADGENIVLHTTTGTKIGTATTQKLGFYNVTPVDQPFTISDPAGGVTEDAEARTAINTIIDRLQELGLVA